MHNLEQKNKIWLNKKEKMLFLGIVIGTSRPEASNRRAQTEGGGSDAGERDYGTTQGGAGPR